MSEAAAEAKREEREIARFLLGAILESESFFAPINTKRAVDHLRSNAQITIKEVEALILPLMNFMRFTKASPLTLNGIMRLFEPCDIEDENCEVEQSNYHIGYEERN